MKVVGAAEKFARAKVFVCRFLILSVLTSSSSVLIAVTVDLGDIAVFPAVPNESYRFLEKLGSGAAGEVFRVQPSAVPTPLVMKVFFKSSRVTERYVESHNLMRTLSSKLTVPNSFLRWLRVYETGLMTVWTPEQFRAAETSLSSLRSEPIVGFEGNGSKESGYAVLMEEGSYTLDQLRSGFRLDRELDHKEVEFRVSAVLQFLNDASRLLTRLADEGLGHNDIKPENFLSHFDAHGQATALSIADFDTVSLRQKPVLELTPSFVAPERLAMMGATQVSSDLYSLGLTALALVAGSDPPAAPTGEREAWIEASFESLMRLRDKFNFKGVLPLEKKMDLLIAQLQSFLLDDSLKRAALPLLLAQYGDALKSLLTCEKNKLRK